MQTKVAHLFPAFVLKYTGKELKILEKYDYNFQIKINESSNLLGIDLSDFEIKNNNFTNNEFKNQVLSYIFSCAYSDILNEKKFIPNYISGFSMGLYAALYHAKSLNFKTGLLLIKKVYSEVKQILGDKNYVMASVIGFSKTDIECYSNKYNSVEIVIQNGEYSFVLSGKQTEVNPLMEKLRTEGAIHLSIFNVAYPYHSSILTSHTNTFEHIVNKYEINNAEIDLVSMIDQTILSKAGQIKKEVVRNVTQPLNFLHTIKKLNSLEINNFIEVGADTSLLKSSKFIEGDFDFKAVAKGKVL